MAPEINTRDDASQAI